ncbi:unnamed protein product, partial [Urochloa humidicola]
VATGWPEARPTRRVARGAAKPRRSDFASQRGQARRSLPGGVARPDTRSRWQVPDRPGPVAAQAARRGFTDDVWWPGQLAAAQAPGWGAQCAARQPLLSARFEVQVVDRCLQFLPMHTEICSRCL